MHFSFPAPRFPDFTLNIAWPALRIRLPKMRPSRAMPHLTRNEVEAIFRSDLAATPLTQRKPSHAHPDHHPA